MRTLKKITDNKVYKYIPFIFLFFMLCILNIFIKHSNDDIAVQNELMNTSIFSFASNRYFQWEGSWFCQYLMGVVVKNIWCFKPLNTIIGVLTAYYIAGLMPGNEESFEKSFIAVVLFLLWPIGSMSTAGWAVTSVVYLWVVNAMLYCLTITKKTVEGIPVKRWQYILGIPAVLYGSNREQSGLVMSAVLGSVIIYQCLIKHRKLYYIWAQFILSVISWMTVLSAPGLQIKSMAYIEKVVPEYYMYSFWEKFYMVFIDTTNYFITEIQVPVFLLTILLAVMTIRKTENIFIRLIAVFPIMYSLMIHINPFSFLNNLFKKPDSAVFENFDSITVLLPMIFHFLWIGCIAAALYFIFENTYHFWILFGVLTVGMASKMANCISTSIVTSGSRTYIFFYFCVIFCVSYMLIYEKNILKSQIFKLISIILSGMAWLNLIIALQKYGGFIPHYIDRY